MDLPARRLLQDYVSDHQTAEGYSHGQSGVFYSGKEVNWERRKADAIHILRLSSGLERRFSKKLQNSIFTIVHNDKLCESKESRQ